MKYSFSPSPLILISLHANQTFFKTGRKRELKLNVAGASRKNKVADKPRCFTNRKCDSFQLRDSPSSILFFSSHSKILRSPKIQEDIFSIIFPFRIVTKIMKGLSKELKTLFIRNNKRLCSYIITIDEKSLVVIGWGG